MITEILSQPLCQKFIDFKDFTGEMPIPEMSYLQNLDKYGEVSDFESSIWRGEIMDKCPSGKGIQTNITDHGNIVLSEGIKLNRHWVGKYKDFA